MQIDKETTSKESKPRKRRMNWDLYYYEQQGNRIYKRYTPFALILTIIFCVIALIIFIIFIILNPREKPDININVSPSTSPSNVSLPRQTSLASLPNVNRPSNPSLPVQPSPLTPDKNTNQKVMPQQMPPQQTPPAQASKPPP